MHYPADTGVIGGNMRKVTVAAVQMRCEEKREANIEKADMLVREAAKQ